MEKLNLVRRRNVLLWFWVPFMLCLLVVIICTTIFFMRKNKPVDKADAVFVNNKTISEVFYG